MVEISAEFHTNFLFAQTSCGVTGTILIAISRLLITLKTNVCDKVWNFLKINFTKIAQCMKHEAETSLHVEILPLKEPKRCILIYVKKPTNENFLIGQSRGEKRGASYWVFILLPRT